MISSLHKDIQQVEQQILEDKEARKVLESDLEEATTSLAEMNRNALTLSRELEMARSKIVSLEDEKQLLNKSVAEQKNAVIEAKENMEDAHSMVLKLGKERESLEKKAKKLEDGLASAKGEILRLRSQMNSAKTAVTDQKPVVNEQPSWKGDEPGEKVSISNAKRSTRRKRTDSQ
ncbi:MAR-binding filament-like protein 1-1 [Linum perenne]